MGGGNQNCSLYVSVECDSQCVYRIRVQNANRTNSTDRVSPPAYLSEMTWYTGNVTFKQTKYFYFPVDRNTTGDMVIFLNKTGPIGKNGDSFMMMAF